MIPEESYTYRDRERRGGKALLGETEKTKLIII